MAKLSIEVDTETGECSVSVNGTSIDNVCAARIYADTYEGKKMASFTVETAKKEDDVRIYTSTTAEEMKDTICRQENYALDASKSIAVASEWSDVNIADKKVSLSQQLSRLIR